MEKPLSNADSQFMLLNICAFVPRLKFLYRLDLFLRALTLIKF